MEYGTSPALKSHEICLNFRKTFEWKFCIVIQKTSMSFRHYYWPNMPKLKFFPQLYRIPSTVLMLSPTVLMLSPTVLMLFPRMYWCYPPNVPNTLYSTEAIPHCTDVIPHCTEEPPQYWRYPPQYWSCPHMLTAVIPPQYWRYPSTVLMLSPIVLMLSPTVLNSLHSTEATPTVLKLSPTVLMLSPRYT